MELPALLSVILVCAGVPRELGELCVGPFCDSVEVFVERVEDEGKQFGGILLPRVFELIVVLPHASTEVLRIDLTLCLSFKEQLSIFSCEFSLCTHFVDSVDFRLVFVIVEVVSAFNRTYVRSEAASKH